MSETDKAKVKELLANEQARVAFDFLGFRVEHEGKIKHLAAAIYPHSEDEVVRPKNGDWFDIRRCNLHKVKISKLVGYYH